MNKYEALEDMKKSILGIIYRKAKSKKWKQTKQK